METVIRVAIVYVFLMAALRFLGKREFGQLSPFDLVVLLMIPELVSQALVREDFSLTNAIVAVGATGEAPPLSVEEHIDVVKRVVAASAKRIPGIAGTGANSPREAIEQGLRVMDSAALSLCMDNDLPIIVFDVFAEDNIRRVAAGEPIGTVVRSRSSGGDDGD